MTEREYVTPYGKLILIADAEALIYCNWDEADCRKKYKKFNKKSIDSGNSEEKKIIDETVNQLELYFTGELQEFSVPLSLEGSEFAKKVWEELRKIKYGETLSYKDLSLRIGHPKSYRGVARVCGMNPIAVILPCHRVVGSNGSFGGYTGGLGKKQSLLHLEYAASLR